MIQLFSADSGNEKVTVVKQLQRLGVEAKHKKRK